jgi:Xaa-Pro aminopeptidase
MDYPAQRRSRLLPLLDSEGIDALLVSSAVNVTYLTGFSGDSSMLVLTRDRAVLISDMRYTQQIADECSGLEVEIRPPTRKLHEAVSEVIRGVGAKGIGFESNALTVAEFEAFREQLPEHNWKGARDRVEKLRMVKDPSEIARIRDAIAIAERAFTAFRSLLRLEDCEKDLCDALEGYVRRAGGQGTSFPPIVAVGERSALPHAPPTGRTVGSGDLLLVDWGAIGGLYKSDLTRVLPTRTTGSSPGDRLVDIHAVVLRAQQDAIRAVRAGIQAQEVDTVARTVIAEAGYGDYFGHGLGHGIGLEIHEGPAIRPHSETVLEEGMIFTIEPGIYLPDWGGVRIEDDVLVTPEGCEVLTHIPRPLEALWVPG